MAVRTREAAALVDERIFSRIVVGLDGTEAGFEACRQAGELATPDSWIELACAVHFAEAAEAGSAACRFADEMEREGRHTLCLGADLVGRHAETALLEGPAARALLHEVSAEKATLLALGTHGHSRASEILLGGTAGAALHSSPCSVLIARPSHLDLPVPSRIVVGFDGSAAAEEALAAAQALAHRFDAALRIVTALRGKHLELASILRQPPFAEPLDLHPVEALVKASMDADLLVVGSRGLHGISALGSVSERAAHRAACSVLAVRDLHA